MSTFTIVNVSYLEPILNILVQSIYARKRRDLEQIATEGFLGSS
jgi:hypothetical protein